MLHVGLDIHSKHISIWVLNETGRTTHCSRIRSIDQMMCILERLPNRFEVCYEASCGYGHYHDLPRPVAARVLVAHPGQLRLIYRSKNKNDRNDAERLAKLLYLGEVPTVHVPTLETRMWRELINCRTQVIAKRTRAKNSVRALLRGAGVAAPRNPGLWTKQGMAWLRRLELPTMSQLLRRHLLVEEIGSLTRQVRRIQVQLNHLAHGSPSVTLLRSNPGVIRTAGAVAAFVDDRNPFRRPKPWADTLAWCLSRTSQAAETTSITSAAKDAGRPTIVGRSRLAGSPPIFNREGLLRAKGSVTEENCAGGNGSLPRQRDVVGADGHDLLAVEHSGGGLTHDSESACELAARTLS